MLCGKEWWAEPPPERDKEDREERDADKVYHHFMLQVGAQEKNKLDAKLAKEQAIKAEERAQHQAAEVRAEAANLLVHSPDAHWDVLREASPPTTLIILTVAQAASLKRTVRRLLKATRPGPARLAAIDALLVDAQAALEFDTQRRDKGGKAAVTIQRLALQFAARKKARRTILTRWEKRWDANRQEYLFVDAWGELASLRNVAAEAAKKKKGYEDDDEDG